MAVCPKCRAENTEGLTRCRACNAILPVGLGTKSEQRWERVRRQSDLVGLFCPRCGERNPYTRFRCQACGANLTPPVRRGSASTKWILAGLALLIILGTLVAFLKHG